VGTVKKIVALVAILALLVAVAVPAIAQVGQEVGNETESGDVSADFSVQSSGDSSNQCVTPLQFGNTGNFQNAQGFLQYASESDDLSGEGGEFSFGPSLTAPCTQQVQQSSAASSS
jgi:hypothetical protein